MQAEKALVCEEGAAGEKHEIAWVGSVSHTGRRERSVCSKLMVRVEKMFVQALKQGSLVAQEVLHAVSSSSSFFRIFFSRRARSLRQR